MKIYYNYFVACFISDWSLFKNERNEDELHSSKEIMRSLGN